MMMRVGRKMMMRRRRSMRRMIIDKGAGKVTQVMEGDMEVLLMVAMHRGEAL